MSRFSRHHEKIGSRILGAAALLLLSGMLLNGAIGSTYYSLVMQSIMTVDVPPVILQNGTAGTSIVYTNSTSAKVSVEAPLYDYVDNNEPDVDSSSDKGMHSNFTAEQAGPDSTYDSLTEDNMEAIEDYVDNDVSDMDGSGDKGTLSDFDNMKTKDGMANLTEVAGGTPTDLQVPTTCMDQMWNQGQDYEWYSAWTPPGSGTVTVTKLWFWDGDGTVGTGETIYMAMYEDGGGYSKLSGSDTTLTGTGSQDWLSADVSTSFEITLGTTYWIGATCASGGTYNICRDDGANSANYPPNGVGTYYQTNNYVLDSSVPTGASQSINKYIIPGITYTTGTGDYELDQEVQFTNVIDFLSTEKLCIYTGTLGNEDLRVDYWNGTGWENLASDLVAFSCNEYTVSLTSVNFTIRFKGGTESSDTTQDQWQIDATLLRGEGAGSKEDAVDQQSNVDSSSDVGTHSDFNAMKTKDGYDNLTESLTEQQYTFFEDWEAGTIASENWTTYSSAPQGRIVVATDTPFQGSYALWMDVDTGGIYSLNELITNFNFSGATQVVLSLYHNEQGDENTAGSDHTDHQNADGVYYTLDGSYWYHLVDLVDPSGWTYVNINVTADPDFQGPVNSSFAIKFTQYDNYPRPNDGRGFENINITYTTPGADYMMDLEVQWIDLPYLLPNENLSIYGGTMGVEDITVEAWNGTDWETAFADLSSGWNNISITQWLTTSNFTIRFRGGNETGDPSQDTWQIDVALIHLWSNGGENYELDLEVQWTSAVYTRTNEELCIKTGTFSGSENIQVRAWNNTGSSWHWLMNLTASQWNNVSIASFLTSSTFVVQFLGGTETGDTSEDSWNMDATLLRFSTSQENLDYVDNNTSDVDSSADKGTHSNFSAQQAGPDSIYDTLTEDDTGGVGVAIEDYVDQTSNVDGVADLGSHDVFANLQASDDTYDNITEAGGSGGAIAKVSTDTSTSGNSMASLSWSHTLVSGSNRLVVVGIGIENGDTVSISSVTYGGEIMTEGETALTGATGFRNIASIYYILEADLPTDGSKTVEVSCSGTANAFEIWAICAQYTGVNQSAPEATDETVQTTPATISNTISPSTDAWVLSVAVEGNVGDWAHGQGQVEVEEFDDASSTSAYAELRGASGETSVDSTFTGTLNRLARVACSFTEAAPSDFQMDLEVQFTDIMDFMAVEYVCIETGLFYGSEDINVTYWTGSGWSSLASDITASTWNNFSVSLTSSNFTIKFGGSDTTSDIVQDGWEIDSVLLRYSGAGSDEDFVDQTSNVDGVGDVGTHDVFADLQASDDSYDNMTEAIGGGGDYQLELEVQFDIPDEADSMPIQRLCIETGTLGSEAILVQWWNGSGWETLWSDLTASSWNNASIAGNLTGSTFTIRFRDGTQSGDATTADSWFIDSVLIYLDHEGVNYEIDLEIQWINVDYTREIEQLCIDAGSLGSETLMVYARNVSTSSWHWVMNLTASQWNNVSVTPYLTSSTFTVRFLGGAETGDIAQDSWNIDATILHVSTSKGTYDYVLRVNNTVTDAWQIRLKKYTDSNVSRLANCAIYFHNFTDGNSNQILIDSGAYSQSTGPWYNLSPSTTIYTALSVEASQVGTSRIHAYLEILVPGSTVYAQYIITFEIT